jgi:translation initiation factor 3 subunit F
LIYAEISLSILNWLSGSADKQSIEVTNCFCVPHKEYEERVEADLQYAQDMFELNKKVATQVKMFL